MVRSGLICRRESARNWLGFLKAERVAGRRPQGFGEGEDDPRDDWLCDRMGEFGDALRQGDFSAVRDEAAEIVERLGVTAEPDSDEWAELCLALLHTHAEVYRVERERHRGDVLVNARLPLTTAFSGETNRPLREIDALKQFMKGEIVPHRLLWGIVEEQAALANSRESEWSKTIFSSNGLWVLDDEPLFIECRDQVSPDTLPRKVRPEGRLIPEPVEAMM